MKILFIGDIVGKPGRQVVAELLPKIKTEFQLDFVVANAENAAGGSGITSPVADELFKCGIDLLTSGDHIWKKKEILEIIDKTRRILRPANYPPGTPGIGSCTMESRGGVVVGVINLVGRVFMQALDCPFQTANREIEKLKKETPIILVDIHAEATSEKIALGYFLDGLVSAVLGTHTHVQTADEKILPKGTAYITDLGMTGPYNSVIGRRIDQIIHRFLSGMPTRFEMATEDLQLHGVVLDVDSKTGRANSIERVQRKL
jgi:hypothetical protein